MYLDQKIKNEWFADLERILPDRPGKAFDLDKLAAAYKKAEAAAYEKVRKPEGGFSFSYVDFMTEILHATLTEKALMKAAFLTCEMAYGRIRPHSGDHPIGKLPPSSALSADEGIDAYKAIADGYKQLVSHLFQITGREHKSSREDVLNTPLTQAPYIRKTILDDLQYIAGTHTDKIVVDTAQSLAVCLEKMGAKTYHDILMEEQLLPARPRRGRQ